MARLHSIKLCLATANSDIDELGRRLVDPTVARNRGDISVRIKGILQNMRDPLDYLAAEIAESLLGVRLSESTGFPMNIGHRNDFPNKVSRKLPGLQAKVPALYAAIESLQPYGPAALKNLCKLSSLVNKNKHRDLSEYQADPEAAGAVIQTTGGVPIVMSAGARFIFHDGTVLDASKKNFAAVAAKYLQFDRGFAYAAHTIHPHTDLRFSETNDPVMDLLDGCYRDTLEALNTVLPFVWPSVALFDDPPQRPLFWLEHAKRDPT